MLGPDDISYINNYHQRIWDTLSPICSSRNDELTLAWLEKATSPLII